MCHECMPRTADTHHTHTFNDKSAVKRPRRSAYATLTHAEQPLGEVRLVDAGVASSNNFAVFHVSDVRE